MLCSTQSEEAPTYKGSLLFFLICQTRVPYYQTDNYTKTLNILNGNPKQK